MRTPGTARTPGSSAARAPREPGQPGRGKPAEGGRDHSSHSGSGRTGGQDGRSGQDARSSEARNLQWLLTNLVEEVPGLRSVAVVSSDGLLLLSSDQDRKEGREESRRKGRTAPGRSPKGAGGDLATLVAGVGSLTIGAAKLLEAGGVKQTVVAMAEGSLFVMSISDGSLLGAHATPDCDISVVAYHMALFVGRAGHVLTPELRSELRKSMESSQ